MAENLTPGGDSLIPLNNFGLAADAPVTDYLAAAQSSGVSTFVLPGAQVTRGGLVVLPHGQVITAADLLREGWTAATVLLQPPAAAVGGAASAAGSDVQQVAGIIGAKFSQIGTAAHGAVTSAGQAVGWLAQNRNLVIVGLLGLGLFVAAEAL